MPISIRITTAKKLPPKLRKQLAPVAWTMIIDEVSIPDAERVRWQVVFDTLEQHGFTELRCSVHLTVDDEEPDWSDASPSAADWCGAILEPVDRLFTAYPRMRQGTSPDDPCATPSDPPGRLIDLLEVPKGHVRGAHERLIFSDRMIAALGERRGDPVLYRGAPRPGWFRMTPRENCAVISPDSYTPANPCAVCGAPYTIAHDIYCSVRMPVAQDVSGTGHFAAEHPIVLSLGTARELRQRLRGAGYSLKPLYRRDSARARLVRDVIARAAAFSITTLAKRRAGATGA